LRSLQGPAPRNGPLGLVFSPDGKRLAGVDQHPPRINGSQVVIWDLASGKELSTLTFKSQEVMVAFSPDGQRLATSNQPASKASSELRDLSVKVWDVKGGRQVCTLGPHSRDVSSMVFSPDGQQLATAPGGLGGSVRVWDVASGKEVRTLTPSGAS